MGDRCKEMTETYRYTVLLVDDEVEVIEAIMKKINWEGLGFSVIGYANNGVKAFEMVEEFQPDVVMTDIRMPYMDGMELSNRIKTEYPATKILLFTGFDEFEYAKEAVHLEVEEYILKPVNSVELTNVFTQMKIKLDQEISEKRNAESLKKYYLDSLPLLQANFYSTLVEGLIREEDLEKYLSDYQISFSGPFFCCLVVHTSSGQLPEGMNPVLLTASVQKQVMERIGEKWRAKCFSYLGNTVLLAQLKNEGEVADLTDECDRFCRYALRIIGAVVTIGVGRACRELLELSQSYSGAREAVSYRGIYGATRAINIAEIAPRGNSGAGGANEADLAKLFKAVRLGTAQEVKEAVEQYLGHTLFPQQSLQQHHIDVLELVSALYRFAENNELTVAAFSGDMGKLCSRLLDLEPEALRKWLCGVCLSMRELMINERSQSTKSFVQKAKEYVRGNYADEEISLDHVCESLGVSNSYFSTIFKKETGNSFIGYLTDYRMEQAARMLLETNEKSYIIAKRVGYADPNYFSYVFKRRYGVSPSKYRTEHEKSEG
ncbi:response regulator transcription factor [Parablautia sp. Marseille-Q6255]|uniref:response regulator transcription factor n=1 Tax=Parablautia sp. Marseille-Q6255 TaxID=3039593 RepID=UPI0024BC7BC5|nr:response regulator [Parablautia sp. Marseille-Q6255]